MRSPFPDGEPIDAAELGAIVAQSVRVLVRRPGAALIEARPEVEGCPPLTVSASLSGATDWTRTRSTCC